jgi:hypothetical protein
MTNYFTSEELVKRAETQRRVNDRIRECLFALVIKNRGEIRLTLVDQRAMFLQDWKIIMEHNPINGDLIIRAETKQ